MKLTALPALLICVTAAQAGTYTFQTINNPTDTTFNQLLGVTNTGTIVGYYGAATNKGYTVAPPYGSFTSENFPASDQTQVIGVNNLAAPVPVGFYIKGPATNGFVDQGGTFTSVTNPLTGAGGQNQLLGINNSDVAAGFYTDAGGNSQGYTYNVATKAFTAVNLPAAFGATMTTAAGIDNAGDIVGFYTNASGTHGFVDQGGTFASYDDNAPGASNTMFTGINNNGEVVGSFVDGSGKTDGLLFNLSTKSWLQINDPNDSITPAFDVIGTTVNGINDKGQLVGFYSDGTNVNGFLATPVPEPATAGLLGLAGLAFVVLKRRFQ